MTLNTSLLQLMADTVTIEPFVSMSASQAPTYGAPVTYDAQVLPWSELYRDGNGRQWRSQAKVIIPERVAVDIRSRVTLPAGFIPNQPPIQMVQPIAGLGLDHTVLVL